MSFSDASLCCVLTMHVAPTDVRYCNATWNSAGAPVPLINATLPRNAWTLNMDAVEGAEEDSYRFNPWRAPG